MIAYGFAAIKTDAFQDLSESIKEEVWDDHPHSLTHIDNYLQYAPAAAVYALNLAGIGGEHNFVDRSIIFFMSNVIMEGFVSSIKDLSHEMRPNGDGYLSFPSGHTAEAFLSATFLMKEYKSRSAWYGIAGYAVAGSVGALRIYNNKHWLNDVVAGAGFGIAATEITYWLYPKLKRTFFPRAHSPKMIFPTYNQQAIGLAYTQYF
jgi:membrane-associated phospholipid phosphatase